MSLLEWMNAVDVATVELPFSREQHEFFCEWYWDLAEKRG